MCAVSRAEIKTYYPSLPDISLAGEFVQVLSETDCVVYSLHKQLY